MEKRISFFEFQSVKSVTKAIEPYAQKKEHLIPQIAKLTVELQKKQETLDKAKAELGRVTSAIDAYEAGIVHLLGFRANELVKKVIETTEKDGRTVKTVKYVPTDIVSYDDVTKQYVITVPDIPEDISGIEDNVVRPIVPPTTEGGFGSDFDRDKEIVNQETITGDELDSEVFRGEKESFQETATDEF